MDPRRTLLQRLMSLIYVFIFAVGMRANWVMCTVIGSQVTTRTATDYYQLSLAISDVSILVLGLFNELMKYWHLYPGSYGVTLCKTQAFLTEWAGYASVMTILIFTTERYLDIRNSLSRYCKGCVYRAKRVILAIWVTALVAALPFAYYHSVFYYTMPPGSNAVAAVSQQWAICTMEDTPLRRLYELSSIVFFLVPGAIMFFICVKMGLSVIPTMGATSDISMEATDGNNFASDAARQSDCRKTVLQLIVGVAVAFFMSWTPFYVQRLYYVYGMHDHKMFYEYLFVNDVYCQVTSFFNYVTATINPIIYNMHNRQAWKQAMKRVQGRVDPIYGLIGTPNDDIPDGSIQPAVCGTTDLGSRRPTRSDSCPLDNQTTDFQTN